MRAVDTNVAVRFLTRDDEAQFLRARAVMTGGDVFFSMTVLLEIEWVLRKAYRIPFDEVGKALRGLASLPGAMIEQPSVFARALDWTEAGMDFADALHLSKADGCSAFISFDRDLAKAAHGLSSVPVEQP